MTQNTDGNEVVIDASLARTIFRRYISLSPMDFATIFLSMGLKKYPLNSSRSSISNCLIKKKGMNLIVPSPSPANPSYDLLPLSQNHLSPLESSSPICLWSTVIVSLASLFLWAHSLSAIYLPFSFFCFSLPHCHCRTPQLSSTNGGRLDDSIGASSPQPTATERVFCYFFCYLSLFYRSCYFDVFIKETFS